MGSQIEEVTKDLLVHVKSNDIKQVEECLREQTAPWRNIIRHEVPTVKLMEYLLKDNQLVHKLIACEIVTLSPFHIAAMFGFNDILVNFLDNDVSVDCTLASGSTALHLASFAGHASTVKMLIDIYKAELDQQDGYGWTSLHYASIEGHIDIVKLLVGHGSNIHIRDKDGTSAAFRAEINGHKELIKYFSLLGDEKELLQISDLAIGGSPDPLYSKVNKAAKTPKLQAAQSQDLSAVVPAPPVPPKGDLLNGDPTHQKVFIRQQSEPRMPSNRPASEVMTSATGPAKPFDPKSATMPSGTKQQKRKDIRRLIRREIEAVFSDYQTPENAQGQDMLESAIDAGVGMKTLKGLMREELVRYKMEQEQLDFLDSQIGRESVTSGDYEDLYNTLNDLPEPPAPPNPETKPESPKAAAPPLPPRNEMKAEDRKKDQEDLFGTMKIGQGETSAAVEASMRKLAPLLGKEWRRLAHALPIDINTARVVEKVKAIERTYPGQDDKQAAVALVEWCINRGKHADTDCLILALRKCGMHDMIREVERITQEFTA